MKKLFILLFVLLSSGCAANLKNNIEDPNHIKNVGVVLNITDTICHQYVGPLIFFNKKECIDSAFNHKDLIIKNLTNGFNKHGAKIEVINAELLDGNEQYLTSKSFWDGSHKLKKDKVANFINEFSNYDIVLVIEQESSQYDTYKGGLGIITGHDLLYAYRDTAIINGAKISVFNKNGEHLGSLDASHKDNIADSVNREKLDTQYRSKIVQQYGKFISMEIDSIYEN